MTFDPSAAALPGSGIYGLPSSPSTMERARVVLVPVPFDATTSYRRGTADGPHAILEASRQVDLFDLETGRPYAAGIVMLDLSRGFAAEVNSLCIEARALAEPVIDAGGDVSGRPELVEALERTNAISEQVDEMVFAECERLLSLGKIVGIVGGDHSAPFGAIRAHAMRFPGLGVLHFDAHADLRIAYEGFTRSHASIMDNVMSKLPVARLVQVGLRDLCEDEHRAIEASQGRIVPFYGHDLLRGEREGEPWSAVCGRIVEALPPNVYVSFDIDGLDPTLCPHTGTPVPGGLSFDQATAVVEAVAKSGRTIVGFDLVEVAPGPEDDEWDANVASRLLYKLIGWTLWSRNERA